jgi:hypothetical protein
MQSHLWHSTVESRGLIWKGVRPDRWADMNDTHSTAFGTLHFFSNLFALEYVPAALLSGPLSHLQPRHGYGSRIAFLE